ncbi:heme-degrading domain-containing protein [Aureimonas sp. AU4]|uniref:heme-degrading domain-containing protein n=1 Tax=Aureimonas sp. AU4 TaxID=1638163 RepID=UPI0007835862|nr:heme-degrading domain-containing protein [Aureimonas sp. AU4]
MTPTLEDLKREAKELDLPHFDYAIAWELGLRLRERAAEQALPVGIEVFHGTAPVFLSLLPGSSPDNVEWLRRKRAVALRFHQSSLAMRRLCEAKGVEFAARYHLPSSEFVASGGAVPIVMRGTGVVGVATVSGLPDTEDHALVVSALRELRRAQGIGD